MILTSGSKPSPRLAYATDEKVVPKSVAIMIGVRISSVTGVIPSLLSISISSSVV